MSRGKKKSSKSQDNKFKGKKNWRYTIPTTGEFHRLKYIPVLDYTMEKELYRFDRDDDNEVIVLTCENKHPELAKEKDVKEEQGGFDPTPDGVE